MTTPIFKASVKNGTLHLENPDSFRTHLLSMPEAVDVIVRRPKRQRTNPQNRYLHGYLFKEVGDHLGYTMEEAKEILKAKFLKKWKTITTKLGEVDVEYIQPTHTLTTVELEEFASNVRTWASQELSLYLLEPNEVMV